MYFVLFDFEYGSSKKERYLSNKCRVGYHRGLRVLCVTAVEDRLDDLCKIFDAGDVFNKEAWDVSWPQMKWGVWIMFAYLITRLKYRLDLAIFQYTCTSLDEGYIWNVVLFIHWTANHLYRLINIGDSDKKNIITVHQLWSKQRRPAWLIF